MQYYFFNVVKSSHLHCSVENCCNIADALYIAKFDLQNLAYVLGQNYNGGIL